jgi:phospholipid/cholesterol/gamma-HCH transport system substrate-binding protein
MDDVQVTMTNLQVVSANLRSASTNLPTISDALGNEARDLPRLVLQSQTAMRELERLIEAMQRHWLLRKYVNHTNPPPLR